MATRDLVKEQEALKKFGSTAGRMPESPQDWSMLHQYAYGSDIPAELKAQTDASLAAAGVSPAGSLAPPQNPPLSQTVGGSNLTGLQQSMATAKAGVEETSQPSYALNLLQNALKEKTGTAAMPLGESEVFKQAGVGGIGALSASLNARSKEMEMNRADFINVVNGMAGQYKDQASTAMFNYNAAVDEYNVESQRLQNIVTRAQDHKNAIELLGIQNRNAISLREYDRDNPPPSSYTLEEVLIEGQPGFAAFDRTTGQWHIPDASSGILRSDRHNNPMATKSYPVAMKQLSAGGLVEGVDFIAGQGTAGIDTDAVATIAFKDVETGVKGNLILLEGGQIKSWYANPKYGGTPSVLAKISELSGQKVNSGNAQDVFNGLGQEDKMRVLDTIYQHEAPKGQLKITPIKKEGKEGSTDLINAIKNKLKQDKAIGEDNKVSWETYLMMKQDWINNNGTANEFDVNFPIAQYLDYDNQQEYLSIIGK